jgi:hypothetical protein
MPPSQDDVILLSMTTRGGVVLPLSPKYDMLIRKQHNADLHSNKPAFFVECLDTGDVVEAVKFASKHEMPVSVRSGGHGADGSSLKGALDHFRCFPLLFFCFFFFLLLPPSLVLSCCSGTANLTRSSVS